MKTLPVSGNIVKFSNSFRANESEEKSITTVPYELADRHTDNKKAKKTTLVTAAVAVASLGLATYAALKKPRSVQDVTKNVPTNEAEITELKTQLNSLKQLVESNKETKPESADIIKKIEELESKLDEKVKWYDGFNGSIENALNGTRGELNAIRNSQEELEKKLNEKIRWYDGFNDGTTVKLDDIRSELNTIRNSLISAGLCERGMVPMGDNLMLMRNMLNDEPIPVSEKMQEYLKTLSSKYQANEMEIKPLSKDSVIWSFTTETQARGTGGQGEIVTQQAQIFEKLGVNEFLVLGANEIPGIGGIIKTENIASYSYNGEKMMLNEFIKFPVDTFRGNKHEIQWVTAYKGYSKGCKQPVIMFENPKYYSSTNYIYGNSTGGVTERERATFTGKAAYILEKIIRDPKSVTNYQITDAATFETIKAPEAVYIHDAAATPYVVAARLVAPLESANGELSQNAAEAIMTKTIKMKGHNVGMGYQGQSWGIEASDIINTICGKYAADVYQYAETGFGKFKGMDDIAKVLTTSGTANFANWGIALSNRTEVVSRGDLMERIKYYERGGAIQHILEVGEKSGAVYGHGNSWERALNEVSEANLENKYNPMINKDKIVILQNELNKICKKLNITINGVDVSKIEYNNFEEVLTTLKTSDIPEIKVMLDELDKTGVTKLRKYRAYTQENTTEQIIEAKKYNKELFIDQIKSMIKYNKKNEGIFKLSVTEDLGLDNISDVDDVFIISCGARLVEQKDIPLLVDALKEVNRQWATRMPGKPKPLSIIGGPDNTADKHFHAKISESIGRNMSQKEFTPNRIWQSASDFTMRTSAFEPDGDLAESLYKGTPTVTTRVGGYVDRIEGTDKGILTKRSPLEISREDMVKDYVDAIFEAADIYYNKPAEYKKMVRAAIDSEYSWIVRDAEGNLTPDCGAARDLADLGFNLADFKKVA